MVLHNDPAFTIYFGDSQDHCVKSNYTKIFIEEFKKFKKNLNLKNLIFLKQVHGTDGEIFTDKAQLNQDLIIFPQPGDFLITNLKNVGIGVLTADCLPVVFYDTERKVAAVAHAGWRGAVAQINLKVIQLMQEKFGTKIENIKIFFGPCAKSCCYQVQEEFLENPEILKYSKDVISKKNNPLFFDLPKLANLQLLNLGIKEKQIETSYNLCTICNHTFHSYRRDKERSGRQATIISLK
jgi:polyphenol oxidase